MSRPIILFRFHEHIELCRERLALLSKLNPDVPIYCVYGGPPESFATARSAVLDLVQDVHLAESHDFMWHWLHMDLDVKHWYRAVGHKVDFDVLFDYEWDLLTLDSLKSIYPPIDQNTIALCALTELTSEIEREWQWTAWPEYRPAYDRFIRHMQDTFDMGELRYGSHGPGTVLPRRFLEQFAELDDVELVISEITYPAFAQVLGFELINNNLQRGSVVDHFDHSIFNSDSEPIRLERIVAEVLKPGGRKAFHPVKFSFGERRLRELRARPDDGLASTLERLLEAETGLRDRLVATERELEAMRGRVAGADEVLRDVMSSASWRITKPLRALKQTTSGRAQPSSAGHAGAVEIQQRGGGKAARRLGVQDHTDGRVRRVKDVRDRLVNTGTFTAPDGRVHQIFPTSVALDRGQAIRDWVTNVEAASTVETGLAHAVATLFICEGLLLTGHPDLHHIAFDPYQAAAYSDVGRQVIDDAGLSDIVEVQEQDSKIGLAKLVEQNRRVDLAFVDGDHRFEGVFIDLVFFDRLVRPGGIVIIDDLYLPAVARATRFAVTNLGWTSEQTEIGGEGGMAVFRTPWAPPLREWNEYIDF